MQVINQVQSTPGTRESRTYEKDQFGQKLLILV